MDWIFSDFMELRFQKLFNIFFQATDGKKSTDGRTLCMIKGGFRIQVGVQLLGQHQRVCGMPYGPRQMPSIPFREPFARKVFV